MKKILQMILAATLMLSLAACGDKGTTSNGSNTMSKEEMLEVAEAAEEVEMYNALFENIVNAKQTYCGKILEVKAPSLRLKRIISRSGKSEAF